MYISQRPRLQYDKLYDDAARHAVFGGSWRINHLLLDIFVHRLLPSGEGWHLIDVLRLVNDVGDVSLVSLWVLVVADVSDAFGPVCRQLACPWACAGDT